MVDDLKRKPSSRDPRGYESVDLPDSLSPEAASAVLRLLAHRRESIPERLAQSTDDELRAAFMAGGFTDRDIAREVIIGRTISALYDLYVRSQRPGEDRSPTELVEAGIIDQQEWEACFEVRPADIDDELRNAYGDA